MIVALIDNGSLEPAAHRNLRTVAAALSACTGVTVHAVSWKHSDRLRLTVLDNQPAATLVPWVRRQFAAHERDFIFVPFFISAQGAIGSALRDDLEKLRRELGELSYAFTRGIAAPGAVEGLAAIVADRIRATIAARGLKSPNAIVVDHGGPSRETAALRDEVAGAVRNLLGADIAGLAAASMEGTEHAHNLPLLVNLLQARGFDHGDVVVAPLFLSPGRHAGLRGDLAQIIRAAAPEAASGSNLNAATPSLRCHFTELVGTHPSAVALLAIALSEALDARPQKTESHALRVTPASLPSEPGTNLPPLPNFA